MEVSVGERAVVGITPEVSPREFSRLASLGSGGFSRRTSSRSTCRNCSPRRPPQPAEPPASSDADMPTPVMLRPYSSRELTPTIACHRRSLSSRPRSSAKEYRIEEIGSE